MKTRRPPWLRQLMRPFVRLLHALSTLVALGLGTTAPAAAQDAVVHAILFYSPTCPHCHEVINNDLPPLRARFGDQFVLVGVDVSTQGGGALYQATADHFSLPQSRLGVPALVVGGTVLVGSLEIPEQLPGIIERGLATGGIDWPAVGAVREVLAAQGLLQAATPPNAEADTPREDTAGRAARRDAEPAPSPQASAPASQPPAADGARPSVPGTPTPEADPTPVEAPSADGAPAGTPFGGDTGVTAELSVGHDFVFTPLTPRERFLQDPVGNGVAVVVLLLLLVILAASTRQALRPGPGSGPTPPWLFPMLAVVGAGIAAYLSFVEVTGAPAVCGPVGDCNTVQQSDWARLFGVLPVGVLGLVGYGALMAGWAVARWGPAGVRLPAWTAVWGMAWMGTAFSAYLTFLEPFVIGATCAWCVSSALIMAAMLWLATREMRGPARRPSDAPAPRTRQA